MNDTAIRVDDVVVKYLEENKLIPRESYKSVIKRLLKISNVKHIWKGNKCSCGYDAEAHADAYI